MQLQYKQMKPDMGIFIIRSKRNNKCYLQSSPDLKSTVNSARFKLNAGVHPCRELQKEWQQFTEEGFTIEVLERLEYDKDGEKADYSEELDLLQMIWEEKLAAENLELYKKRF